MVLFYLIKGVFYNFFIMNFFLLYIKMSENIDLAYYQKNRDVALSKGKDYYKNNRDKYRNLSEEEKNKGNVGKEKKIWEKQMS